MITIHLIFNSHLDPIWLWQERDGLDEVLNTCRYVSGLLDQNPDLIYTRGEAWTYRQVRRFDPALFARIQKQVLKGQWSPVGGWYIQPDCNLPSGFAMKKQIAMGKKLFLEYFGLFPRIGYNVDSFGHAASLPGLMREAGQDCYIMMRPQEDELRLPARLFRWKGNDLGPEVTVFRIAKSYCSEVGISREHVMASLTELPAGVQHTMCFVGIGDHGGGPTAGMVEWCRSHADAFPGAKLEFSSPERFFTAIASQVPSLPLYIGEMQNHAVGCYSVVRKTKAALRAAEHRLTQAEIIGRKLLPEETSFSQPLEEAWEKVCFHHFHDTLGGTCLPTAFERVDADLGFALSRAAEMSEEALRRYTATVGESPWQRILFFNASEKPFSDHVEFEPWLEWSHWQQEWQLVDEDDQVIPRQLIAAEAVAHLPQARLLIPLELGPGELKTLRIVTDKTAVPTKSGLTTSATTIRSEAGTGVELKPVPSIHLPSLGRGDLPSLQLLSDPSDTWSHGVGQYSLDGATAVQWQTDQVIDHGPLMASLKQEGKVGDSEVALEWRVFAHKPWVEGILRVDWREKFKVLKLVVPFGGPLLRRFDGIPDGSIERVNRVELPLRDWTCIQVSRGLETCWLALICPDAFALDVQNERLQLTLLRSPLMAWHDPTPPTHPRCTFSDRGEHFFRFRLMVLKEIDGPLLDEISFQMQRPPLTACTTQGMKNRDLRFQYSPEVLA